MTDEEKQKLNKELGFSLIEFKILCSLVDSIDEKIKGLHIARKAAIERMFEYKAEADRRKNI